MSEDTKEIALRDSTSLVRMSRERKLYCTKKTYKDVTKNEQHKDKTQRTRRKLGSETTTLFPVEGVDKPVTMLRV